MGPKEDIQTKKPKEGKIYEKSKETQEPVNINAGGQLDFESDAYDKVAVNTKEEYSGRAIGHSTPETSKVEKEDVSKKEPKDKKDNSQENPKKSSSTPKVENSSTPDISNANITPQKEEVVEEVVEEEPKDKKKDWLAR